jgi:hypothetical protein
MYLWAEAVEDRGVLLVAVHILLLDSLTRLPVVALVVFMVVVGVVHMTLQALMVPMVQSVLFGVQDDHSHQLIQRMFNILSTPEA